ncbi:DUF3597 domain-containing protein [Devosia sp.]|uniref:DUF3597 domain-containing protein n=1 Tax=Devosia sp. TaxID=1871048 RepID=UPI003A93D531
MGFFSDIVDKIFNRAPETAKPATPTTFGNPKPGAPAPSAPTETVAATQSTAPASAGAAPTPASQVDVAAILDQAVADSGQTLNWRTSIVDLMKALGIDSSLSARKELADELGYSGDKSDSASMNIWLHKQVLQKLAANGGKVPADLLD